MSNIIVNVFVCNYYAHIFKVNSVMMELFWCVFSFVVINTAFPHSISMVDMILLLRVLKRQRISKGLLASKVLDTALGVNLGDS